MVGWVNMVVSHNGGFSKCDGILAIWYMMARYVGYTWVGWVVEWMGGWMDG